MEDAFEKTVRVPGATQLSPWGFGAEEVEAVCERSLDKFVDDICDRMLWNSSSEMR